VLLGFALRGPERDDGLGEHATLRVQKGGVRVADAGIKVGVSAARGKMLQLQNGGAHRDWLSKTAARSVASLIFARQ